jgi:transcriptional regulator with XRE-family HTH domain
MTVNNGRKQREKKERKKMISGNIGGVVRSSLVVERHETPKGKGRPKSFRKRLADAIKDDTAAVEQLVMPDKAETDYIEKSEVWDAAGLRWLGDYVRSYYESKGMTQRKFSEIARLRSSQTISELGRDEGRALNPPTLMVLRRIAEVLPNPETGKFFTFTEILRVVFRDDLDLGDRKSGDRLIERVAEKLIDEEGERWTPQHVTDLLDDPLDELFVYRYPQNPETIEITKPRSDALAYLVEGRISRMQAINAFNADSNLGLAPGTLAKICKGEYYPTDNELKTIADWLNKSKAAPLSIMDLKKLDGRWTDDHKPEKKEK